MATHSSILAWRIPWTEQPGRIQSRGHKESHMTEQLTDRLQPTRLLCPQDSPGSNTGVGCRALLQGIFLAQGSNPAPLHWEHEALAIGPPGKSQNLYQILCSWLCLLLFIECPQNSIKPGYISDYDISYTYTYFINVSQYIEYLLKIDKIFQKKKNKSKGFALGNNPDLLFNFSSVLGLSFLLVPLFQ